MRVSKYWEEKTDLVKDKFKGLEKSDEVVARKVIICTVMKIPENDLGFYISKEIGIRKFVLEDTSAIDSTKIENVMNKVYEILEEYFYKNDYCKLCEIGEMDDEEVSKEMVCSKITELVDDNVYPYLEEKKKRTVDLLEKIYFYPIDLLNEYIEARAGSDVYYTILMEQWKTANEMAANISTQRNNMNNFYMSLMSILIGGILFSDQLLSTNDMAKTVLFITIAAMGVICCNIWVAQIDNYGKLNGAKYDIINELERSLPANVLLCEYNKTENNARRGRRKINFSKQEKSIAKLFKYVMIIVPLIMLIGTWWDKIWTILQAFMK